jgi:hypothetical protein
MDMNVGVDCGEKNGEERIYKKRGTASLHAGRRTDRLIETEIRSGERYQRRDRYRPRRKITCKTQKMCRRAIAINRTKIWNLKFEISNQHQNRDATLRT